MHLHPPTEKFSILQLSLYRQVQYTSLILLAFTAQRLTIRWYFFKVFVELLNYATCSSYLSKTMRGPTCTWLWARWFFATQVIDRRFDQASVQGLDIDDVSLLFKACLVFEVILDNRAVITDMIEGWNKRDALILSCWWGLWLCWKVVTGLWVL